MTYRIPGSQGLRITDDEIIIGKRGEVCNLPRDKHRVKITLYGVERYVDITWLKLVSMLGIKHEKVDIFAFRFEPQNNRNRFKYFVTVTYPQWYDKRHRYRLVPRHPNVAISKNGHCISALTGRQYPVTMNAYGYPTICISDPATHNTSYIVGLHRLVCLAWVHNKCPQVFTFVNHIDGVKTNNDYRNLEWIDAYGNVNHAFDNSLRTDNMRCKIKDKRTGEVMEFRSITALSKFLDIGARSLKELNRKFKTGLDKIYDLDVEIRDRHFENPPQALQITDKVTHEVRLYPSLRAAERDLHILRATLKRSIRKPNSKDRYIVKRLCSPDQK